MLTQVVLRKVEARPHDLHHEVTHDGDEVQCMKIVGINAAMSDLSQPNAMVETSMNGLPSRKKMEGALAILQLGAQCSGSSAHSGKATTSYVLATI